MITNRIIISTLTLLLGLATQAGSQQDTTVINETYEPARDTTIMTQDTTSYDDDDGRAITWKSNDGSPEISIRLGTMFALGISTVAFDGSLNLPAELDYFSQDLGKSTHFKWDVIRHRIGGKKNAVSFEYGLALSYHNYAFTNPTRLEPGQSEVTVINDIGVGYKKNKFKSTFIEVPLMVSILGNKETDNKGFNLLAGGYAGILLKAKQKFKGPDGREKVKDDFNMNKFRYGVQAMAGYGHFNLYMQYSLVDLFKDNQGPSLTPINIGVVLAGF